MGLRWVAVSLLASLAHASDPAPIGFEAGQWLGNDGNWSTIAVDVGSPAQKVNLLVSTASSELWVVGPGGCLPNEPVCDAARGSVFTPTKSKSWQSLGSWQLGLSYYEGNGDYAREVASGYNPVTGQPFSISNISTAAINTTEYYQGLLGLGIARANFEDGEAVDSPLTGAAITARSIPSVSYGYTAGAHYRNMPASLTLGGFDAARLVPHNIKFTLTQEGNMPCPLVRGIELAHTKDEEASEQESTEALSTWDERFVAVIDSSTPYLWLPGWLCDRFATALNLTYNETFDLYTLNNSQYQAYSSLSSPSLTFSLSSLDNYNDLGAPLKAPGVVNVTVSARALTGLLQYPFKDPAILYGDPAVPYFALRRSADNSTVVLGRSFLQETYLITRYDEAAFSVHAAAFPDDPIANADVIAIAQGPNSPYAPKDTDSHAHDGPQGLGRDQIIGISVGAVAITLATLLAAWLISRRRKRSHLKEDAELAKAYRSPSSSASHSSQDASGRLLSRFIKRKRPVSAIQNEKSDVLATEAPNTQIHELPGPASPIELDGTNKDDFTISEELQMRDPLAVETYEEVRQRIERQLQGPVPAYMPPMNGGLPPPEKAMYYPDEQRQETAYDSMPSAISNPMDGEHEMYSPSTPSDAPRASWTRRLADIPAPIILPDDRIAYATATLFPSPPSPCQPSEELSLGSSIGHPLPSPLSPAVPPMQSASHAMHRSPITASNIVCLGPLPDGFQPSGQSTASYMMSSAHEQDMRRSSSDSASRPSLDTLGSDYTEAEMLAEATPELRAGLEMSSDPAAMQHSLVRLSSFPPHRSTLSRDLGTQSSRERVGSSTDLVHVPQMAARRYSWED